ncbi:MAG: hypothetical protein ABL986_00615 [Vicinamibacterales bacterium]
MASAKAAKSRGVLRQPAIADLREAPETLDHVEGVLAAGAGLRAPAINRALPGRERLLLRAASVDAVAHPVVLRTLAVELAPLRLVAEEHALVPVEQLLEHRDVGHVRGRDGQAWTIPCGSVPTCTFIPKCHVEPFVV